MASPYIGQIIATGFNFAPVGWLSCNGALLSISEFSTLFNLLGTTYGGDGVSNFGLPDLRGRSPVGMGQGSGLSNYVLGQQAGAENVTLTANQIGIHNHPLVASSAAGTTTTPGPSVVLGQGAQPLVFIYGAPPATTALAPGAIGPSGFGNQPHPNVQPLQVLNYIICYEGIYPSQ